MGDSTTIEWTDASWTPIRARYFEIQSDGSGKPRIGWHCEHVSEACRFCYAEAINRRLGTGLDFKPGNLYREEKRGYKNGEAKLFLDEKMLIAPLRWKRPRMIFVCSMTDLFADFVPDAWIDRVFAVMALAPRHIFQVLTKRPERMRAYLASRSEPDEHGFEAEDIRVAMTAMAGTPSRRAAAPALKAIPLGQYCQRIPWPLPNVWLATSVEDQATADERIPRLLATPAAIRFASYEPALGPVDFTRINLGVKATNGYGPRRIEWDALTGWEHQFPADSAPGCDELKARTHNSNPDRHLHQIIAGGESGPHARPAHPDWFRQTRDDCSAAGVAYFFKQWGNFLHESQKDAEGRDLHAAWNGGGDDGEAGWHRWPDGSLSLRLRKKQAGALLDGRAHRAFPGVTA